VTSAELLLDLFSRIDESVRDAVSGASEADLAARLGPDANSVGWLVWHLTRIQDDHIAGVAGSDQVWLKQDWVTKFGLPFAPTDHGYGHTSEQVAAVQVTEDLLLGYFAATKTRTDEYVATLTDADLDRVVDSRWDPPVTLGARLVSVVNDCTQHAGQAAFIRGQLQ
jgi:uncharacterized damage-inducible protein DinB